MPRFYAQDLAQWTGGTWTRVPAEPVTAVIHDTRRMKPGALYVALPGERFDGHTFLPMAPELGAVAALVARGRAHPALPCLEVEDPLRALQDMARSYRQTLGGLVVGITGSAGKTTVKDLVADMLTLRGAVCRTPGNWNNHIGLPLSLLSMETTDEFGVFEAGMNRPDEIAGLCSILQPICGLITSIGVAHIGAFDSVDAIAREKAALLASLPPEGVAILDVDSPWVFLFESLTQARVVRVSLRTTAEYVGQPVEGDAPGMIVRDERHDETFEVPLPLPGSHMMRNVLQAVAVAREFGLSPEEIREGLWRFAPPSMRWEQIHAGGFQVINDAYNANPLSMRSAIKTFAALPRPVEKWVVLGGMRELGDWEIPSHREIGEYLARTPWTGVILVGDRARPIGEGFQDAGGSTEFFFQVHTAADAASVLREHAGTGAAVLLKASRMEKLEAVVERLQPGND